jgi:formylglycine-generating enzyme required for sulfatase activity
MRVFVSYARIDKPYCVQIVDALDVHEIWFDQRLYAGQNWWKEILRRLDWCEGFLYLLSPESVSSDYCKKEYDLAHSLGRHIIPVLIRETPHIPNSLSDIQYVNLTKGLTTEAVKGLLNSLYLAEHENNAGLAVSSISPSEIRQPLAPAPTVIRLAATAMENGQFDQAVFLLRQAKANGYTSRFIDIDAILHEAETALERQSFLLEAEREYKQIEELLFHTSTRRLGWEAFQAFKKAFPAYDPNKLALNYAVAATAPASPAGIAVLAPPRPSRPEITLPMLEWCSIQAGKIQISEFDAQGQRTKKAVDIGPFQISRYPVTIEQYQLFIDDPGGYANPTWWRHSAQSQKWHEDNPQPKMSKFKGNERPREMVSWYEAMAFCGWLSNCLEMTITLPTAGQWQRAFQGDDNRAFPWGNSFKKEYCNTAESDLKMTTPVNHYPNGCSPYGVWDMAGNVWEWCLDRRTDVVSGKTKTIVRGGSFISPYQRSHIAFQYDLGPEGYHASIGFRMVCNT